MATRHCQPRRGQGLTQRNLGRTALKIDGDVLRAFAVVRPAKPIRRMPGLSGFSRTRPSLVRTCNSTSALMMAAPRDPRRLGFRQRNRGRLRVKPFQDPSKALPLRP